MKKLSTSGVKFADPKVDMTFKMLLGEEKMQVF